MPARLTPPPEEPKLAFPAVERGEGSRAPKAARSSVFALALARDAQAVGTPSAGAGARFLPFARVLGRGVLDLGLIFTIVFLLVHAVPGDLAAMVLGEQADASARAALRHRLGLDDSILVQYASFWKRVLWLDWGASLSKPSMLVRTRLWAALGPTTRLALSSVALAAAWGIPVGLYAARHEGQARGRIARATMAALASVPLLATAPVLLYLLCVQWQLVPLPGDSDSRVVGLLFAASLLALPLGAHVARAVHGNLVELRRGPCLRVARAKGASAARTWFVHALPLTAGVVLTLVGAQLGAVLGGAMVIERLFERRGLGTLILESYRARDMVMLEASVLASAVFFVFTQTLFHSLFLWVDPRASRR